MMAAMYTAAIICYNILIIREREGLIMQVNGENIRFLGEIIGEIKEKMPDGYDCDDIDNVQIFRCIEDKKTYNKCI